MSGKQLDPVQMRNAIITVGATMLLVGVLAGPPVPSLFATQIGRLRIVFGVISGAIFAIGLGQIGEMVLKSLVEPWYARPGSALMITILCGMVVIGWVVYRDIMLERAKETSMEDVAHLFVCLGVGLILITVLNWVSYDDSDDCV
jgi:hypothetical protein